MNIGWTNTNKMNSSSTRPHESGSGYRKTSNMIRTLVGNKIVDHSDAVRASPVGAAPTTS